MVPLPRETTGKMPIPDDDELEEMKETMRNALLLKGITLDVSVEVNPFMGRDVTYKLCRYSDKASIEVYSARFPWTWVDNFDNLVLAITRAFHRRLRRREIHVWEGRLRVKRKRNYVRR